ncbi:MAG: DUF2156 domain-containing protein [Firmicutes bacterium]|nr:DUF2156 domain-containing protein [Bacillota bacterium]
MLLPNYQPPNQWGFYYNRGVFIINFQDISLENLRLYSTMLHNHYIEVSDLAPTSLYLWRHSFQVKIALDPDYAVLICRYRGSTYSLTPLFSKRIDPTALIQKISAFLRQNNQPVIFRGIPSALLPYFPKDKYRIIPDRQIWDYLYLTKDLIELRGRKYQQKRNQINRFRQTFPFSYHSLSPDDAQGCLDVFNHWAADKGGGPEIEEERRALMEALQNFTLLPLKGGVLKVDGRVQAFAIGTQLNKDTALIHFEKANPAFSGIYAVINQLFVANEWSTTRYINREDDMGLPGLRQAKKRYHPFRMIEKYTIVEASYDGN